MCVPAIAFVATLVSMAMTEQVHRQHATANKEE